jgi:hypothetical protein
MAIQGRIDLAIFDGRLLDGLNFCRKVYAFFDQVRGRGDGIERLRLLKTKEEKRLVEELIPIAQYVQARYNSCHRLKVRWRSGSQPYDAVLLSSGIWVEKGLSQKRSLLEVTTSVHPKEHLARELVNAGKVYFGVKGISRDKKSGKIVSEPNAHHEDDLVRDLVQQILERLRDKGGKGYSPDTVLVINCVTNTLIHEPEWQAAIKQVRNAGLHSGFREVFLVEGRMARSTAL